SREWNFERCDAAEPRDARVRIAEDVGDQIRVLRAEDADRGGRHALEEDPARAVAHASHRERLREHALRAERGERVGQVDEAHLATAKREGEAIALDAVERRQTEAMADLEHR